MSNIYIQEPPTNGKVLLRTSVGDIDIELWSKEAPLACKNFVQLCLEGYYDNTIFHRVVKAFIVQGGDPTGTGTGGESIYGGPFKDEIHSRLRFNRRGLVAMANAGKSDNGSQFFFTLGSTPELQNKHTIFAKIGGKTIYNMIKLEEGEIDSDERPLYPNKILSTEVLSNPFPDIIPRELASKASNDKPSKKKTPKPVKDFKLLSFGEEAEDDEEQIQEMNQKYQVKKKHNPEFIETDDILEGDVKKRSYSSTDESGSDNEEQYNGSETAEKTKRSDVSVAGKIREKLNPNNKTVSKLNNLTESSSSKKLKWDKEEVIEEKEPAKKSNQLIDEYIQEKNKYADFKKTLPKKGESREKQTLDMLMKFRQKINKLQQDATAGEKREDNEDDSGWLVHALKCEDSLVLAKDANVKDDDWFEITDPRNKLNKRRRETSKVNIIKIKEDLK